MLCVMKRRALCPPMFTVSGTFCQWGMGCACVGAQGRWPWRQGTHSGELRTPGTEASGKGGALLAGAVGALGRVPAQQGAMLEGGKRLCLQLLAFIRLQPTVARACFSPLPGFLSTCGCYRNMFKIYVASSSTHHSSNGTVERDWAPHSFQGQPPSPSVVVVGVSFHIEGTWRYHH